MPWNNHLQGLGQLVKLRGPDAYNSELTRAALYGYAYNTVGTFLYWNLTFAHRITADGVLSAISEEYISK